MKIVILPIENKYTANTICDYLSDIDKKMAEAVKKENCKFSTRTADKIFLQSKEETEVIEVINNL